MGGEKVEGGELGALGIILSGKLRVMSADGGGVLMNTLGVGNVFGAATVFLGKNEMSDIYAVAKSSVLFVSRDVLEEIFRNDVNVAISYSEFLSRKIEFLNKKIIACRVLSVGIQTPDEGFAFLNSLDFVDLVTIGVASVDEIKKDMEVLKSI